MFYTGAVMAGFLITGGSLNPARSFGPGFISGFSNHEVWIQLPLFILVPSIAGLLAGLTFKFKVTHGKSKAKKEEVTYTDNKTAGAEFGETNEIEVIEG